MFKFLSVILFVVVYFLRNSAAKPDVVVCYYEDWAENFSPNDIDVSTCTHINFSFMGINKDGTLRLDDGDGNIKKLAALKKKNPKVKILLSVGGWSEGTKGFSKVAASSKARKAMADDCLSYLKKYNLDGIDIDWEYPGKRGGSKSDKKNYITMLKQLKSALQPHGYILTAAVCSSPDCGDYDVKSMNSVLDYIGVMTYDYHDPSEGRTGQNSPLYASHVDDDKSLNVDASIKEWIKAGASPSKILLGLGFYGHSFKLAKSSNHGIGAKTTGPGQGDGELSYGQICKNGWTSVWDDEQKVPYAYKGTQWVGYDNPKSIGEKVKYLKSKKLAGVIIWAVDLDDKAGSCGTKNGLIKAVKNN